VWDFGDNSTGSGKYVTHTYHAPATYSNGDHHIFNVTLTVTDGEGNTDSSSSIGIEYTKSGRTWLTGSTISPPTATNPGTFTMNELNIYETPQNYKWSVQSGYGTSSYGSNPWQSMTSTEWVTDNTIDYTFTSTGQYIVVVWAAQNTTNVDPTGIPIAGWSVNMNDDDAKTDITGFDVSSTQQTNSPVTLTVNAQNASTDTLYYRWSSRAGYGTSSYDGNPWQSMTSTEWVTDNSIANTFTQAGKYIIVVWVTHDTANYGSGVATVGWSVDIQ
jgi:hypothetical protein